jgi:hypothetical protein
MVSGRPIFTKNAYTNPDLAVRSARTNSIATPDPTTCRDMSACITSIRTETTLSCAWSWHSDPRAATEAGDAEQVANISATGRRKPKAGTLARSDSGHQPTHFLYSGRYRIFLLALTKTFTKQMSSSCVQIAVWAQ